MAGQSPRRFSLSRGINIVVFPIQYKKICAAGITSVLFASFAHAGLFDDEEARKEIRQLREQVRVNQQQVDARVLELESIAKSRSLIDLFNQLEVLKVEVAKLRGMQEVLNNELENAQKRQQDLYQDSDNRLRKVEGQTAQLSEQNKALLQALDTMRGEMNKMAAANAAAAASVAAVAAPPAMVAPPPVVVAPPAPEPDGMVEQRAFDASLAEFRAGKFRESSAGFGNFVRSYPRSSLLPAAQYWWGNSLFAMKDFRGAINAHRTLLAQFPDSNRVPDAMLNIGNSFAEIDDTREARRMWQDVVKLHPSTDAAARAKLRLAR
jgi:tol-pal system protein YbgF